MQRSNYYPRENYPTRNKIVSWTAAIPASFVAFFGAFFVGAFMPWMVVFGGLFGLDAVMRRALVYNLQADMHLHPMELAYHPLRFSGKRIAAFFLRMGTLCLFGPLVFLASIFASSGYMLGNMSRYRSSGLIMLSTFPGFLLTSLWWGTWWMFMAPVLFLGLGAIEATWVAAKYLQLWGYTEAGVPYVPTDKLRQKSRGWLETGKQYYNRAFGAATETAREMRDTAVAGARSVKDTTLSSARAMRDTAAAGAQNLREAAPTTTRPATRTGGMGTTIPTQGYRSEPGELERKARARPEAMQQPLQSGLAQQPQSSWNDGDAAAGVGTGLKMEAIPQQPISSESTQSPFSLPNTPVVSTTGPIPVSVLGTKDLSPNPSESLPVRNVRGE